MAGFTLRHFSPVEFRCKCGCGAGMEKMDADLLHLLDEARDLAGTPFSLTSAYRCPKHNKAVGGVPTSAHTRGYAVDIRCVDSHSRFVIQMCIRDRPSDDPPEPAYPPVDTEGFEIRAFDHDVGEIAVFRLEQPAARGALDALDEQLLPEAHEEDVPVPQLLDGLIDEDGVLMADHRLHAVPDLSLIHI